MRMYLFEPINHCLKKVAPKSLAATPKLLHWELVGSGLFATQFSLKYFFNSATNFSMLASLARSSTFLSASPSRCWQSSKNFSFRFSLQRLEASLFRSRLRLNHFYLLNKIKRFSRVCIMINKNKITILSCT